MRGAAQGLDGRMKCPWAVASQDYELYHDLEWGKPAAGEPALFERLSLEAFQSGLSWITILRKRESFRAAFAGFNPAVVARFDDDDVARLMADAGIVRNRAKIAATIANARALLALPDGVTLAGILDAHRKQGGSAPGDMGAVPAITAGSIALAKELRARGFRFVGPTTAYAMMQATGFVNDHLADCWVRTDERQVPGQCRR